MLCIQELLERTWRRPISTIEESQSRCSEASRRGRSVRIMSGTTSTLPDGVRSRFGMRPASSSCDQPATYQALWTHVWLTCAILPVSFW